MPDLQVASTTDTQEQVNQAAGAVEEIKEKGDQQVDSEEKEQQEQPQKTAREPQEKPKPDEKLLKRVDKLTAQKTAAEERAAKAEAELAEARKTKSEEPKKEEPKAIIETFPKYQAWADKRLAESKPAELEDWLEERDTWKENKRKADEEKEEIAERVREINEAYQERAAAFKETVDDWDEVIGSLRGHLAMQDALLEMEEGPALAYYIAKHPDVSKKLIEMTPARAVAEVGRMAAELFPKEREETKPERKGPDKLPVSSAPAPIKQLTGHSTSSPKSLDELPYPEYRKERDKQIKDNYRR